MKRIRQTLRWILFAGTCAAAATVVFLDVRHSPRWVLQGLHHIVHVSADGSRLVTATSRRGGENRLEVWDTRSGRIERTIADIKGGLISPRGTLMVGTPGDGALRIIDWRTGEITTLPIGAAQQITRLEFSPKGRWLLARLPFAVEDVYIDMHTRTVARRRPDTFVAFMPDDKHVAVRNHKDWDEPLALVSLETGKLRGHLGEAFSEVAVDPSGNLIALANLHRPPDGDSFLTVEVWELDSQQRRFTHRLDAGGFDHLRFSADGSLLAVGWSERGRKGDGRTDVFDTASGRAVVHNVQRLTMVDSAAGPVLAILGDDLRVLDARGAALWKRPVERSDSVIIRQLIIHNRKDAGRAELLDVRTGEILGSFALEPNEGLYPTVTPNGRHLLLRSRLVVTFPRGGKFVPTTAPAWKEWLKRWVPWLLPPDNPRTIVVVDIQSGRELWRTEHGDWHEYRFSDDGSTLVGTFRPDPRTRPRPPGTQPLIIRVWDVHPGRAWRWAIMSGLFAAVGIVFLGRSWRWLRGHRGCCRA